MNIQDAKQEIKNALRAYRLLPTVHQRPLLLMGPPGIGKTAIVEQASETWGVERQEQCAFALKSEYARHMEHGFERIKTMFQNKVDTGKALVEVVKNQLNRAFAFLVDCFGGGQKMSLFVSALTRMDRAMDFISLHGCGPYLEYSQKLLYQEREQELRDTCSEFSG